MRGLSLQRSIRPLRGRTIGDGGSAGRAQTRCARLRATHGYFLRPLRGRRAPGGGTAGRTRARCTRPRATHGYFLRPLRGRGSYTIQFAKLGLEFGQQIARITPASLATPAQTRCRFYWQAPFTEALNASQWAKLQPTAERLHRSSSRSRASSTLPRPWSCCLPLRKQFDRSAVAALRVEAPRVAQGLVALAPVRLTAIPFDRSAVAEREENPGVTQRHV